MEDFSGKRNGARVLTRDCLILKWLKTPLH